MNISPSMKRVGIIPILVLIMGILSLAYFLFIPKFPLHANKILNPDEEDRFHEKTSVSGVTINENNHKDTLTIIAVGDVMFGSNFPDQSSLPPDDGESFMKDFEADFKEGDVVFGNLEGVFMNSGGTPKGKGNNVYCFRQPEKYAEIYKKFGFNLLSIANNHISDFGAEGIQSTASTLDKLGINYAGSKSKPYAITEINSKKIGLAAFAPHTGAQDLNDYDAAVKIVQDLRKQVDIVIVSFHGGGEGEKFQRMTRNREFFYKQNRGNVYEFAHKMVDAGADVVLGHGPHVLRAVETYQNKFIAYSLGNFCTYGQFNLKGVNGLAPLLKLKLAPNGNFLGAEIVSGIQLGKGGPVKDPDNQAFLKIKELTQLDFPDSQLEFTQTNRIRLKTN